MDNIRVALLVALGFVLLLMWQAWEKDYGQHAAPSAQTAPAVQQPAQSPPTGADLPKLAGKTAPAKQPSQPAQPPAAHAAHGQVIQVRTDVLDLTINTQGAGIDSVLLPKYPVSVSKPDVPFALMGDSKSLFYISQGGWLSDDPAPNQNTLFKAAHSHYQLAPGQDTLEVPLTWTSPTGVQVTKIYTFHRNSYEIEVRYRIKNTSSSPWEGRLYAQLQRSYTPPAHHGLTTEHTYTGAAISSPEKRFEKISFDDMKDKPLSRDIDGGWAAMLQHYFVAAIVPNAGSAYHYYSKAVQDSRYLIGFYSPPVTVAPGKSVTKSLRLFTGPKVQKRLEAVAPHLDLTVDYGMLWFLAKPIFWLMKWLQSVTGNWGVAIILLTIIIKLAFFKLSATSYKSMAKMRRVQPRMKALRDRYSDDRQRLNQAMMELYKEEKINPLGGCLPIVVQIPVFIALYWVLLESVELRQAPFFLWIHDLSIPDPYFVLPLIMGVSMFFQQRLNPTPPDPIQAKVMMLLPIVFTVFFAFFPAGLVLYWTVNNIMSMTQQWIITRQIESSPRSG